MNEIMPLLLNLVLGLIIYTYTSIQSVLFLFCFVIHEFCLRQYRKAKRLLVVSLPPARPKNCQQPILKYRKLVPM